MTVVVQDLGQTYVEVKANGQDKDVHLQARGSSRIRVVLDDALPADDTEAYFVVQPGKEHPWLIESARSGNQGIYVRADREVGTTRAAWNVEP